MRELRASTDALFVLYGRRASRLMGQATIRYQATDDKKGGSQPHPTPPGPPRSISHVELSDYLSNTQLVVNEITHETRRRRGGSQDEEGRSPV